MDFSNLDHIIDCMVHDHEADVRMIVQLHHSIDPLKKHIAEEIKNPLRGFPGRPYPPPGYYQNLWENEVRLEKWEKQLADIMKPKPLPECIRMIQLMRGLADKGMDQGFVDNVQIHGTSKASQRTVHYKRFGDDEIPVATNKEEVTEYLSLFNRAAIHEDDIEKMFMPAMKDISAFIDQYGAEAVPIDLDEKGNSLLTEEQKQTLDWCKRDEEGQKRQEEDKPIIWPKHIPVYRSPRLYGYSRRMEMWETGINKLPDFLKETPYEYACRIKREAGDPQAE